MLGTARWRWARVVPRILASVGGRRLGGQQLWQLSLAQSASPRSCCCCWRAPVTVSTLRFVPRRQRWRRRWACLCARVLGDLSSLSRAPVAAWFTPNSVFKLPGTVEAEGYKTVSSNGLGAPTCGPEPVRLLFAAHCLTLVCLLSSVLRLHAGQQWHRHRFHGACHRGAVGDWLGGAG